MWAEEQVLAGRGVADRIMEGAESLGRQLQDFANLPRGSPEEYLWTGL